MSYVTAYFYESGGRIVSVRTGDKRSVQADRDDSEFASILIEDLSEIPDVDVEDLFVNDWGTLGLKQDLPPVKYDEVVPVGEDIVIHGLPIGIEVTFPSGLTETVMDGDVVVTVNAVGRYRFELDHPHYFSQEIEIVTDPAPVPQIRVDATWGHINGNLADQPDVQAALDAKADVTTLNTGNWDTAYNWGDHAAAGYLTAVGWLDVTGKPSTFPPSDHSHGYADLPITSTQVGNWDLAYGWGDHSTEGYLKSVAWSIISSKPATATRWPAWSEVTSKPSTFTPSSHSHGYADLPMTSTQAGNWDSAYTLTNQATDSATANRLMRRNSAGDVWCRLFRSTYGTTNSNIAGIYTTQTIGGDYMRPSTPAQLLAALPTDAFSTSGNYSGVTVGNAGNADTVDNLHAYHFLRSNATDYLNGKIYFRNDLVNQDAYRDHGVFGHYNSSKINHIWSMGTAYRVAANGLDFGNLYGLAYYHTNNGQGTLAGGHQMIWCSNGNPRCALGTDIWTAGSGTATDWHATSDIKFKKDIRPLEDALSGILQLRGVRYKQKTDEEGLERIGVIAQEMEKVYPEFVVTHDEDDPEKAYKTVNYPKLTAVLVEAIKEQNQTIENQQAQLDRLEAKLNKLLGE